MSLTLLCNEVVACNAYFVFEYISGDVNHLHTVAQSGWYIANVVGSGNK